MVSVSVDLEEQLFEAGNVLLQTPNELLTHLDQIGKLLGKVEQSPSKSMLTALSPTLKALIKEELLRHENEDVRVAVASCISEITRITAPDAPYEDNQMKQVFQLIVSSFENLSDNSSQSYSKRTSILETVAKVRSCVVMLDLECDGLIAEMFQHFLKAIRDHHQENVFSSMEVIMTLVLEESEDIGFELISPILASLKKDNQEVQPIAQKLAENVIRKCEAKVKPCLLEAKSSMNFSFDDYTTVISEIGKETNNVGHGNAESPVEQLTKDSVADGASSGGAAQDQVPKESETETLDGQDHHAPEESGPGRDLSALVETGPEEDHTVPMETGPGDNNPAPVEINPKEEHSVPVECGPADDHPDPVPSSKSTTSNGVAETENKDASASPRSSEKPEHTIEEDQSHDGANVSGKAEPGDSDSGKVAKLDSKSARVTKKRSKKPKHSLKSTVPSDSSYTDTDKEAKRITDGDIIRDKEPHASPSRDPSTEVAVHKENDRETEQLSSPIALENELQNVIYPSPSGNVVDEGLSRKGGKSKKKNKSSKKTSHYEDVASKVATEGTSNSEVKLQGRSMKKARASNSPAEKVSVPVEKSKVEVESESDSEIKVVNKSSRKADARDHIAEGSSSQKKVDDKRRVHGKTTPKTVEAVSSPKPSKVVKDDNPLKETLKTSSKRKRTPTKENATDAKKYDKDLVGARIKVWWPMDKMFYEGVVDSFDSKNKKHTVAYADGDKELLNLRDEKWELVEDDDSMKDGDQEAGAECPDTSPEIQKKAKTGSETSAKKGKTESLREEASSSRSKGTAKKSGRKDVKHTEVTPKSSAKSEDFGGKSKVRSKKHGKSSVEASGKAGKSKDDDSDTPKPIVKFKLGSPKTVNKSTPKAATKDNPKAAAKDSIKSGLKGYNSKSSSKSTPISAGKVKSATAKPKETKEKETKSPEVVKAGKNKKGKSAETSKGKGSEGKSGKKRRRS